MAALVSHRAAWMRDCGFRRGEGLAHSADALAGQLAEPDWPVWVLADSDGTLLGCTTATDDTSPLGWTEQERAEPATFLVSTVTDPARVGDGVGMVIAFWALDHPHAKVTSGCGAACSLMIRGLTGGSFAITGGKDGVWSGR
ncbi:MAG: hypothetical protein M3548_05310 [Actinomycetota bacterium]|nr:hypothetical protein [Actinomycetota bacterium]